jgi:hypothetical protein
MRRQFPDPAGGLRRQTLEHIAQVHIGLVQALEGVIGNLRQPAATSDFPSQAAPPAVRSTFVPKSEVQTWVANGPLGGQKTGSAKAAIRLSDDLLRG